MKLGVNVNGFALSYLPAKHIGDDIVADPNHQAGAGVKSNHLGDLMPIAHPPTFWGIVEESIVLSSNLNCGLELLWRGVIMHLNCLLGGAKRALQK
jgi:hypothetical protein